MSDHLTNNSVILDRSVGLNNSDDGLNEAFAMMRQETKRLLAKINTLEESLAKERKLKAGFKVICDSIDSENKRLRNIISRKYKKHLESRQVANESEKTHMIKNLMLHDERSSTPPNEQQCLTPARSESTQTSHWFSVCTVGESQQPFSEMFYQSACTSLKNPLQQESLDKIEDLTEKLWETAKKLKEAEESSEMMAIQIETYKSDFMSERSDRENAMGRIMELERELTSMKRLLEDQNRYDQHSLSCRLGQSGTQESFQIQSYQSSPPIGTFPDDVLIARGPCQETAHLEHTLEFDWHLQDDRNKRSDSPVREAEKLPTKKGISSSSESLDLLPTEHGGDDYYQ